MKIYAKPSIIVIVSSPMVLIDVSNSEGDDNEFANSSSFENEVLGINADGLSNNLWDED